MTPSKLEALKKRLERAFLSTKGEDMYPYLVEQASLTCTDAEWEEIERFTRELAAQYRERLGQNP